MLINGAMIVSFQGLNVLSFGFSPWRWRTIASRHDMRKPLCAAMFPMVSQFYDEYLNGMDGFYGYRLNLAILRLSVHIIALLSAEIHF